MSAKPADHMKYRFLGNSGLLVSKFGFGSFVTFDMQMDFEKAYAVFEHAFKSGINFFDSAETYADGEAEKFIGKIVKTGVDRGVWSREDLVLTTKLFFGTKLAHGGGGPNDTGLSRKHVIEGMKGSLKRFDLDYVDVVFCHRQDPYTPMEEIVRAMNYVIEQGWAFYWGTSEWTGAEVIKACEIADRLGLIRPICDQTRYNILDRSRVDYDFVYLYKKYKYGVTAFSALSSGVLTGKYSNGIPEGSRMSIPWFKTALSNGLEEKTAKAIQLAEVAKEIGCTLPQLAIAWCVANTNVSTILLGASRIEQLDENLKALEFEDKITPEIRAKIDAIAEFKPELTKVQDNVHQMRGKWL
ncbi:Voltage-gated potassium channel subunit beta-2 [Phytophthora pseudosyringae]|uniref:Voltage-gated potassium channel subunit beta-2 n=1 Tax=Phytophthora pseudosyringae TaxID=221518 RepID=A0A8T1WPY5_9STRA|nr:Voltage-gated potassium channel subunit beta-2 [Phytophthora pseudosyringae]